MQQWFERKLNCLFLDFTIIQMLCRQESSTHQGFGDQHFGEIFVSFWFLPRVVLIVILARLPCFVCIYLYVTRFIWTQTQHDSSLFVTLFLSWVHSAGSGKGTKQASACSILQRLKQRHRLQVKAKWMDEHPSTKLLRTDLFLHMTLSCKITKIEFGPLKFSGPHIEYDFFFKKVTGECPSTP